MFAVFTRGLPLIAALALSLLGSAHAAAVGPSSPHREAVDEQRYPWSSIGKLFNETGAACSGAVISRDKILTAAHCVFNARTRRFIPAEALHFLVGYRTGRYSAHARIASYEVGPGFDPLRYNQTSQSDWAVLTVKESLPLGIEPLRLRRDLAPSGTKAVLAGYGEDRAFAMTADRDCELRDKISAGRFLLHTCRSTFGYSGAPILVSTGGGEMQIAGIQIAAMKSDGGEQMIAVPAQAILGLDIREDMPRAPASAPVVVAAIAMPVFISLDLCAAKPGDETPVSLPAVQARLDWSPPEVAAPVAETPDWPVASTVAWLASEPFAIAYP